MKKQNSKTKLSLRPSPNEEATIVQAEKERRRRVRIKQVREQERAFALQVRQNIKNKRDNELKLLSDQLKVQWTEEQLAQQNILEEKFRENLQEIGEGHSAAFVDRDFVKQDHRVLTKKERKRALERHNKAMLELLIDRAQNQQSDYERAEARARAMDVEQARAAQIAALPKPVDLILNFDLTKDQKLKPKAVENFKSTHYHLQPAVKVEKASQEDQVDAREAAEKVEERINSVIEDTQRSQAEQAEKARLRHKHAMAQLQLQEDHKKLMGELNNLERMDRQRRQEAVAKIPVRIFQPPHKRLEDAEERQRDLEQAFEDMYMLQTGYTGDLTIALEPPVVPGAASERHLLTDAAEHEPEPEPTVLPVARTVDSDETLQEEEEDEMVEIEEEDDRKQPHSTDKETKGKEPVAPKGKDPVRRLLGRIQRQRGEWKKRQIQDEDKKGEARKKPPATATTRGKPGEPRVHILTPLPEEEEPQKLEDTSEALPTVPLHTRKSRDVPRVDGQESPNMVRTLLHPYEAAKQARTVAPREATEGQSATDEPPSAATTIIQEQHLLEQQRLKLQLQEQHLIQQRLEEQLAEYHSRLQHLSHEVPKTPYEDSGLGTGTPGIAELPQGPHAPGAGAGVVTEEPLREPSEESEITDETDVREEPGLTRGHGTPESGSVSLEEQTAEEHETSETASGISEPRTVSAMSSVSARMANYDQDFHPVIGSQPVPVQHVVSSAGAIPSDVSSINASEERRGFSFLVAKPGQFEYRQNVPEPTAYHESASSGSILSDVSSESSAVRGEKLGSSGWNAQNIGLMGHPTRFPTNYLHAYPGIPREKETTVETFPGESFSGSQEGLVSEELSSSDNGSPAMISENGVPFAPYLDPKMQGSAQAISKSNREVTDKRSVSTLASVAIKKIGMRIGAPISAEKTSSIEGISTFNTDLTSASPPTSFIIRQPDPSLRIDDGISGSVRPVSALPGLSDSSPNYLDNYCQKWEEERKLIEAQRFLIRQRQEKQFRRMRYYQDILERHGNQNSRSSPSLSHQLTTNAGLLPLSTKKPAVTSTSSLGRSYRSTELNQPTLREGTDPRKTADLTPPAPDTLGEFLGRFNKSLELNSVDKENSSAYGSVAPVVPPLTGLRGSSSNSDDAQPAYLKQGFNHGGFTWSNVQAPPFRQEHKAGTSSSTSRKSTSTGDFSLPSSTTEYHPVPHLSETSASQTPNGIAGGSRSSITTLSELTEMMTKLTSTAESGSENGVPQGSSVVPQSGTGSHLQSRWSSNGNGLRKMESNLMGEYPRISETQHWYIPHKASTQSVGSTEFPFPHIEGTKDSEMSANAHLFRSDTDVGVSQGRQWYDSPRSSVTSIGPASEVSSPGTANYRSPELLSRAIDSGSSQIQQWFVPQKSSTHSIESIGPLGVDPNPNQQFISRAPHTMGSQNQQWYVPAKASTVSSSAVASAFRKEVVGSAGGEGFWYPPIQVRTESSGVTIPTIPGVLQSYRLENPGDVFFSSPDKREADSRSSSSPASLSSGSLASDFSHKLMATSKSIIGDIGLQTNNESYLQVLHAMSTETSQHSINHQITDQPDTAQGVESPSYRVEESTDTPPYSDMGQVSEPYFIQPGQDSNESTNTTPNMVRDSNSGPNMVRDSDSTPNMVMDSNSGPNMVRDLVSTPNMVRGSNSGPNMVRDSHSTPKMGMVSDSTAFSNNAGQSDVGPADQPDNHLQDAFFRTKQSFIKKSQARVERAKAKRFEVKPRVQVKGRVKPAASRKPGTKKTVVKPQAK